MKSEIKARWLEALRSGQYKQAKGALSDGKGFCCLGVLCNLHAIEHGKQWTADADNFVFYFDEYEFLPKSVQRWAGLKESAPAVNGVRLSYLNDDANKKFKTIAKLIEKHL